jgi:hypothetical protein
MIMLFDEEEEEEEEEEEDDDYDVQWCEDVRWL